MPSEVQYILDDINKAIEKKAKKDYKRFYLGASSIGLDCQRTLWFGFRHCQSDPVDALSQKRFDDGHCSESVYIKRLKDAGYQLQHEEEGKQYGFSALGGWFRGHRDGKLFNIPSIGNAIWEHKCSASWKSLENAIDKHGEYSALKQWSKVYYDQAQLYMGYDNTHWHILTCASEGSRKESIVLTPFNQEDFNRIEEKARYIITSDSPPDRISSNPTDSRCAGGRGNFRCSHFDTCHDYKIPKPNCRNCAYITFDVENKDTDNPKAICGKHNAVIPSLDAMHNFYECHRFNPCFFKEDCLGLEGDDIVYRSMEGREFKNGLNGFTSMQFYLNQETKPWLTEMNDIVNAFGISSIEVEKL